VPGGKAKKQRAGRGFRGIARRREHAGLAKGWANGEKKKDARTPGAKFYPQPRCKKNTGWCGGRKKVLWGIKRPGPGKESAGSLPLNEVRNVSQICRKTNPTHRTTGTRRVEGRGMMGSVGKRMARGS